MDSIEKAKKEIKERLNLILFLLILIAFSLLNTLIDMQTEYASINAINFLLSFRFLEPNGIYAPFMKLGNVIKACYWLVIILIILYNLIALIKIRRLRKN
ncbi:hypothetical protein [Ureibacillus sp. FSL E2-3493]|uniref:hypothetical protein n=1 Tax=Ureibacillus sp. FSL E2-3493 TaxID=2921367 RepID=UPI00311953E3